ncbi:hypothetical protein [Prosthecobacter sp.]|uniref:hypothetical protein n=1 Tax=Prosthecobacter sp. TaxID=1965333 RepID=UPI00378483EE
MKCATQGGSGGKSIFSTGLALHRGGFSGKLGGEGGLLGASVFMTLEDAVILINNLDFKESHRRYASRHGLLLFDRDGQVVAVYRYKEQPDEWEQHRTIKQHPGCLQISTSPGWYPSIEELKERIDDSMRLFAHTKTASSAADARQTVRSGHFYHPASLMQRWRDFRWDAVVALSGEQTVLLYCHLRACERSLFSLEEGLWIQFMEYYSAKEMAGMRRFVENLREWISAPAQGGSVGALKLLRGRLVARLSGRAPERCHFRLSLLSAAERALRRFMELRFVRVPPSVAELTALRQEFAELRACVESGCGILRWLPVANEVDCFYKTLSLRSYSIAEILETLQQQPPDGRA